MPVFDKMLAKARGMGMWIHIASRIEQGKLLEEVGLGESRNF